MNQPGLNGILPQLHRSFEATIRHSEGKFFSLRGFEYEFAIFDFWCKLNAYAIRNFNMSNNFNKLIDSPFNSYIILDIR